MKKIKLSEESYNKLKNRLVNEISYGMADSAYNRSDDLFSDIRNSFEDFYSTLTDAIIRDKNPYLIKIKSLSEPIYDILKRKADQQSKFFNATDSVDHGKFYDSEDAKENDIEDMDLNYLQNKFPK